MANKEIYSDSFKELMDSTLNVIERAEREITLNEEYKDIVFILGDNAHDISFIRSLAMDFTNKTVAKAEKSYGQSNTGENGEINEISLKYQNVCPESSSEGKPTIFYYGWFNDARNTSVDIASTYIANKVLSHAERIKVILVVNYSSLDQGIDIEAFINRLKHVSGFLKDIEKYRNSFALLAIRDDQKILRESESSLLDGEISLLKDIRNFLLEMGQYIADKQKDPATSFEENVFFENVLKLIDIVLQKEDDRYKKFGIFRKLDDRDSNSNITALQVETDYMKTLLCDELSFTEKLDIDSRVIVSEKSESVIDNLVEELSNAVSESAKKISEILEEYYRSEEEKILGTIEFCATGKTIIYEYPVNTIHLKFKRESNTLSSIVEEFQKSMTIKELTKKINEFASISAIDALHFQTKNLEKMANYINILEGVSRKRIVVKPWGIFFKGLGRYISESKKTIQKKIDGAAEIVKHRIQINLANIGRNLRKNCNEHLKNKLLEEALKFRTLHDETDKEYEDILKMPEKIKLFTTIDLLINEIMVSLNILQFADTQKYITNIMNERKVCNFLHLWSEEESFFQTPIRSKEFEEATDFLRESKKWYRFLSDLYIKLSDYGPQMERKNYIDFLNRSSDSDIFQETNITPINFEIFLRKIRVLNIAEYENIRNIPLTESRLNELNQLVDFTLKHTLTIQCSGTHMLVKGNFVSLKETNLALSLYYNRDCHEFHNSENPRKFMNIFALNTIFIDEDVDLYGKKVQLIFISPRWEVIGDRSINLNGRHGRELPFLRKARDCLGSSHAFECDGVDGEPGEPGESGGIFYGIGDVFVNGANLTISANGGDGGRGQNGASGGEGVPGQDARLPPKKSGYYPPSQYVPECCHSDTGRIADWVYSDSEKAKRLEEILKAIRLKTSNSFDCKINSSSMPTKYKKPSDGYSTYRAYFDLFGTPGGKGGNGGHGGKGGLGGHSGSVKIVEINEISEINLITNNGRDGDIGIGGFSGKGGIYGKNAKAYCFSEETGCFMCIYSSLWTEEWFLDEKMVRNDKRGPWGEFGEHGANSENMKYPEPAMHIQELSKIINEYKRYLRGSLTHDLMQNFLSTFYEQISKNYVVRKAYDTTGLVAEFTDLEDHYYSLNKEVDFYPIYKSLLERIVEYSECSENCDSSSDEKTVLSYLYAAVLSKINSLKESTETDLIIDIEKYLDTIKTEMDLLQDVGNVNSKVKAVDEMKKEYKYRIDRKIEEAKYFIEKTVNPEIHKISRHIDDKIDSVINDIIYLQNKTQIERNDFVNKQEELKNTLGLKKLFDLVKDLGHIVSYLLPYGSAIKSSIEIYTSVGEYFLLGNNEERIDLSNVAAKLNALENNIKLMKIKKTEYINNVLNELSEEITQNPEELRGISSEVTEMKNKLSDIRVHDLPYNELRELENELKDTLRTKEIDLESQNTKSSSYVTDKLASFIKAIEVGSMFVETYNKMRGKGERIDSIGEAIQQKENELILLREYEEQIYEIIRPALKDIKDKLQVFSNQSNKISHVAFEISKWKMISTLKDIKIQLQRIAEEFHVKADLSHCLEKLQEAISLLITIYDRIQQYQDKQILRNHIANVCSVVPWTLATSDQNLVNITRYLDLSIRSSLVLKNYQTALNAFKQWVFPFSSHYLEGSMLSSPGLKPDGNILNLVFNAAKELQILKRKISLYKASAKETDETLIRGEFNCRCVSCEPFYVWKDEQYRDEISRLLSGETVALKADVHHSESGKNAIKFKLIKLHFKSKNETIQSSLDQTLKMFDVSLTHIGNSYYRYDDEIYLITSPKRSIVFSFEESARTGNPVRENEVYIKIREGDLMLSPYTMWLLKLNATKRSSFRELDIYKGEVDLELEGKGSYVISNFEHDASDSQFDSSDLNYRTVRSLVKSKRTKRFVTSGSTSKLSSPINAICNFLKMYITSLIAISFNKITTYGSKTLKIERSINSFPKTSANSARKFSCGPKESGVSNQDSVGKRIPETDKNDSILGDPELKNNYILWEPSISMNLNAATKCNEFNEQVKPFICNEQESNYYTQGIQVQDLNHSLLFADFISRSLTGVKYGTGMDESLMSPKQVICKKCDELLVKDEKEIIQNLRLFSKMDENNDISWFSSVKQSVKSLFKFWLQGQRKNW